MVVVFGGINFRIGDSMKKIIENMRKNVRGMVVGMLLSFVNIVLDRLIFFSEYGLSNIPSNTVLFVVLFTLNIPAFLLDLWIFQHLAGGLFFRVLRYSTLFILYITAGYLLNSLCRKSKKELKIVLWLIIALYSLAFVASYIFFIILFGEMRDF